MDPRTTPTGDTEYDAPTQGGPPAPTASVQIDLGPNGGFAVTVLGGQPAPPQQVASFQELVALLASVFGQAPVPGASASDVDTEQAGSVPTR